MSKLRSVAERLTHGLKMRRRLPPIFGEVPLFVSTEGGLKYLRPTLRKIDPDLLEMAAEMVELGDVVWDVGANVGLFTFAAAWRAGPIGKVYAIEPDIWLVDLLRRSAKQPGARAPVEVLPVAISDALRVSRFHIAKRARAANYLDSKGSSQTGGVRETQCVVTVTLDWLLDQFPPPRVLKIDVEGAEDCVLKGASRLLSSHHPRILCEVNKKNARVVGEVLRFYGYTMFDATVAPARRVPLETPVFMTLAYARSNQRETGDTGSEAA